MAQERRDSHSHAGVWERKQRKDRPQPKMTRNIPQAGVETHDLPPLSSSWPFKLFLSLMNRSTQGNQRSRKRITAPGSRSQSFASANKLLPLGKDSLITSVKNRLNGCNWASSKPRCISSAALKLGSKVCPAAALSKIALTAWFWLHFCQKSSRYSRTRIVTANSSTL